MRGAGGITYAWTWKTLGLLAPLLNSGGEGAGATSAGVVPHQFSKSATRVSFREPVYSTRNA